MSLPKELPHLTQEEAKRYTELCMYYTDMNLVRGAPFPVIIGDTLSREKSLEYYNKLESSLESYQGILGKATAHPCPKKN